MNKDNTNDEYFLYVEGVKLAIQFILGEYRRRYPNDDIVSAVLEIPTYKRYSEWTPKQKETAKKAYLMWQSYKRLGERFFTPDIIEFRFIIDIFPDEPPSDLPEPTKRITSVDFVEMHRQELEELRKTKGDMKKKLADFAKNKGYNWDGSTLAKALSPKRSDK